VVFIVITTTNVLEIAVVNVSMVYVPLVKIAEESVLSIVTATKLQTASTVLMESVQIIWVIVGNLALPIMSVKLVQIVISV